MHELNVSRLMRTAIVAGATVAALALGGCQTSAPATHGFTPAQVTVLKQQGFVETADGWTLGLSDKVLFDSDADALSIDSQRAIGKLGESLLAVGIGHLRVFGYTDASGTDAYNDALSARRAAAVALALTGAGMNPANIQQRGMGKQYPVADNRTAEGRAQNRRVAIVVEAE
ncbi:OmpA family protein [Paraburkholderia sartisoli]|uniref:Outer membrane protein OmpA n=1 Tax=Paraburkholderia sartisoli TaxID=83784 RepID=A0A1H4H6Z0_9BURK|nr:OmpA family protein [Paraburkholderia sartisoli]SEB17180.1 Outer membrane protein OmpA [Paraburkholderia sartisoli]